MNVRKFLPLFLRRRLDFGRMCIDDFVSAISAELPSGVRLLDAGAGECWYKEKFSHLKYYAADFGKGKDSWDYTNLDVAANLLELPFKSGSFDAALATQVLEHINRPAEFLKELNRILKPGGHLYLTAPQGFKEHQAPYDFFRYTSYGLRFLFEEAGFKVEYIKPKGGFFYFLSDRVQPAHGHLFNNKRHLFWKIVFLPLEPVSKVFFTVIAPLVIGMFDSFDRRQKLTNGYMCKVTK
ncbi:MAG TPA: class I SAM-dependent methyltransferase [Thermodesulfobacteriota bacterium]|nr:class I SAM-dependent methyltransferase [Thermodesulfobacteriota bacterium]